MQETLRLYVLDRNYSSWSMRAGVTLRLLHADATEVVVRDLPSSEQEALKRQSPSGLFPLLEHGDVRVWESLAICEYLAECFPESTLWPKGRRERAAARSLCAHMHAGFATMRRELSMNIRARYQGFRKTLAARADISAVTTLWRDCLARFGGGSGYLFGDFGIVDAFFAPVVTRFHTYDVRLDEVCTVYVGRVLAHPAVASWIRDAKAETHSVAAYDLEV